MAKKKKYYSRAEVASLLGVSLKTVANYTDKGIIPTPTKSASGKGYPFLYPAAVIDRLAKQRDGDGGSSIKELENLEGRIDALKKEYHATIHNYRDFLTTSRNGTKRYAWRMMTINTLLRAFFIATDNELPAQERTLLEMTLQGCGFDEICEKFDLGHERVRQKINRAYRHILRVARDVPDKMMSLIKENNALRVKIAELERSNALLEYAMSKYGKTIEDNPSLPAEVVANSDLLQSGIGCLGLSVRAYNALIVQDVNTVADLVFLDKNQLKRLRGLGGKTLNELERVLKQNGLCLGMKQVRPFLSAEFIKFWRVA